MSTNDNSINARFCWQTRIRSRRDFHTFCYTDGLFKKKKYACQIVFLRKKIFFRDFRFSFKRESSFPQRIPGSAEGTPCLYHACAKEDGGLAGGSAVKCRKAIFAYVAKRKSSSRTLYTCWNRVKKKNKKKTKEILILKVWFYGNSVKLRQSPTHGMSIIYRI